MIPPLLPAFASEYSITFSADTEFPGIALPPELRKAVATRKQQFLAGRHCAAAAIRQLSGSKKEEPIGRDSKGVPVWPPGLTGSITHTATFASAAVARLADARSIGIDAECVMDERSAHRVAPTVLLTSESAQRGGLSEAVWTTLIFSAKESIFKALFREAGGYFDYSDVAILEVNISAETFTAELKRPLAVHLRAGFVVRGRFAIDGDLVRTGTWLPPDMPHGTIA